MDRDAFGRDNAFDVRAQSALKVSYFTLVCAPIDAVQYYTAYDHFRSGQKEHLWLLQRGKSVVATNPCGSGKTLPAWLFLAVLDDESKARAAVDPNRNM
jgi:superfamily II DNA helicase RecQ